MLMMWLRRADPCVLVMSTDAVTLIGWDWDTTRVSTGQIFVVNDAVIQLPRY